jgi:hypothetical protein
MSTLKLDTLLAADGTQTTEPSIPALDQRMAKAWVNFNGTSTVAIRDSYNVSSITDNATGHYTVNLTTAMADTNYAALVGNGDSTHNTSSAIISTTAIDMRCRKDSAAYNDPSAMGLAIFGN